jgi:tRNA modification GTPase
LRGAARRVERDIAARARYLVMRMTAPPEHRDTIFALATAPGVSAVAVLRVSGPRARAAMRALSRRADDPAPRVATRRTLRAPADGAAFDDALVLWFPAPRSFTGEDVAEFHLHGGRATCRAALSALAAMDGLRLARPGEFARRAFDNDRLDLSQVEALADLVEAETAGQARQAMRQLESGLGTRCEDWRRRLLEARAHAEAEIDFPEEDLPAGLAAALAPRLVALEAEIAACLDDGRRGERLRDGFSVAVLGPPNAGKSSIINYLSGAEAAIVAAVPGTTRDVLEVDLDLGGWPVTLADTAGLRALGGSVDPGQAEVEREGMRRARRRADTADLRLVVLPADAAAAALSDPECAPLLDRSAILAWNRVDLVPGAQLPPHPAGGEALAISALTGAGLDRLAAAIEARAAAALGGQAREPAIITRARHREALEAARRGIARAREAGAPELLAEELRAAGEALGRITGRSGVEDMLDVLFSSFCIGK